MNAFAWFLWSLPGLLRQSRRPLQRRRVWMPGLGPRRTRREIVWRHRGTRPEPLLALVPIVRAAAGRLPCTPPEGPHPVSSDRPVSPTVGARVAVSRRNGARSRGSMSAAGKARSAFSARNAKHGLRARALTPAVPLGGRARALRPSPGHRGYRAGALRTDRRENQTNSRRDGKIKHLMFGQGANRGRICVIGPCLMQGHEVSTDRSSCHPRRCTGSPRRMRGSSPVTQEPRGPVGRDCVRSVWGGSAEPARRSRFRCRRLAMASGPVGCGSSAVPSPTRSRSGASPKRTVGAGVHAGA